MTQTLNDTLIQGTADVTQLTVQGYSSQTQPLQEWQTSGGTALVRVTADGRLQLGSNFGGAADALLQVNYLPSGAMPTSVWHAPGTVSNAGTPVNWVFHELQVSGTAAFSGLHNGLYTRLTHNNTGSAGAAELRPATFQVINQRGSASIPVGQLTGLRATASNAGTAFVNRAVGVEATVTNDTAGSISQAVAFSVAPPSNAGTIASLYGLQIPDLTAGTPKNYAIYTGLGP